MLHYTNLKSLSYSLEGLPKMTRWCDTGGKAEAQVTTEQRRWQNCKQNPCSFTAKLSLYI